MRNRKVTIVAKHLSDMTHEERMAVFKILGWLGATVLSNETLKVPIRFLTKTLAARLFLSPTTKYTITPMRVSNLFQPVSLVRYSRSRGRVRVLSS